MDALHLGVVVYLLGDPVKAAVALRGDLKLDYRADVLAVGLVPVDKRLVAEDHALALKPVNGLPDLAYLPPAHDGKLFRRQPSVLFK